MGLNQYDKITLDIAKSAQIFLYSPDCACWRFGEYHGGVKAEDYNLKYLAAYAWAGHAIYHRKYWGVHYKRRHVLHVKNRYGLTSMGGLASTSPILPME